MDEKAGATARRRGLAGVTTRQFRSSAEIVVGLIQVSVRQKRSCL